MKRNAALYRVIALGFLCMQVGCSIFDAREPATPCDPQTDPTCRPIRDLVEPITPEIVRDNYRNLFEDFVVDPHLQQTLTLEASGDFTYIPDTQAGSEDSQGLFSAWHREDEKNFMRNLLESGGDVPQQITLVFSEYSDTGELLETDEVRYNVVYELTLTFPPVNGVERQERYCGRALWDLVGGDQNFWSLSKWEDLEPLDIPNDPCSGTIGSLRVRVGN